VLHDLKTLDFDPAAAGIDVVVSGHSHRPRIETVGGLLYLNPGSAGPRRFSLPIALATLELVGDTLRPRLHHLAAPAGPVRSAAGRKTGCVPRAKLPHSHGD
jgi:predicted phosphodiesterase